MRVSASVCCCFRGSTGNNNFHPRGFTDDFLNTFIRKSPPMKTIVTGILTLLALFQFYSPKRIISTAKSAPYEVKPDSGYIHKDEAVKLLLQAKYDLGYVPEGRDTLDLEPRYIGLTDTIGKYYRLDTGNYLVFLQDIIHPDRNVSVLLETTPDNTILKAEPYWAGMYQCCLDKPYEVIKKYPGGYFGAASCGTGSGHCSSNIYFFKEFSPQGNSICSYIYTGWCRGTQIACHLNSDIEIRNDTVIMHYKLEHLKERRNGKYKVIDTEKFDVKYVEREQGWVALDSTKIYEFPL